MLVPHRRRGVQSAPGQGAGVARREREGAVAGARGGDGTRVPDRGRGERDLRAYLPVVLHGAQPCYEKEEPQKMKELSLKGIPHAQGEQRKKLGLEQMMQRHQNEMSFLGPLEQILMKL